MHAELRPRDSLSVRSDDERRLVKQLVARYRALPEEQKRQLPALLNAVGKLEVAAGSFESAELDFAALAGLVKEPRAQAEAHYNASRAALEARDWTTALREILQAARIDARRFAPFPLGKYTPQRILGAGGFGVAFLCTHKYMEKPVVVKTLLDDLDRGIDQLFSEAQALRRLNHPSIVRVQDCGYTDAANRARPFLVMDYFPGCTLEEHIRQGGVLTLKRFLPLARRVAEALQAAHAEKVLHRDVKPGNLLVRAEGSSAVLEVQLIDFGLALRQSVLAKSAQRSGTLMGASIAGTLDYAAPEQMGKLPGTAVGPYSDVYGFGKTCCTALFGTTQPVLKHWQSIPEPLADLLGRCLADLPGERPADFTAVLRCLNGLEAVPAAAKPAPRRPAAPPAHQPEERERERRKQAVQTQRRADPRPRRPSHDEEEDEEERERPRRGLAAVPPWAWAVVGGGVLCLLGLILAVAGVLSSDRSKAAADGSGGPAAEAPADDTPPAPGRWPIPPPAPAGRRVYLADLKETMAPMPPPFWKFTKGTHLGDPARSRISLGDVKARKGLGTHPPQGGAAVVKYDIPSADSFWAVVGINDSSGPFGAFADVFFEVYGDGSRLWRSKPLRRPGAYDVCQVSLKGVKELELRVPAPQGSYNGAHAVWFDPYIIRAAGQGQPDSAEPPPPRIVREGTRVYLVDLAALEPGEEKTALGKGTVSGDDRTPIRVNGTEYPRGLGVPLAPTGEGSVSYALAKKATAFQVKVAIDDSYAHARPATFEVVGDGKVLWKSDPVVRTQPQSCLVDVTGVEVLELRASARRFGRGPRPVLLDPCVWRPDGVRLPREPAPIAVVKEGAITWKDGRAYLSDLKEFDVKPGPWPFSKNGATGDNGQQSILVAGKRAAKGLSMHPPSDDFSRVRYRLGGKAALFEATAALDDSVFLFGVVGFEVLGDGKLLWKSEPMRRKGMPQSCRVRVKGVDVLELRTTVQGNQTGAHAVWVDPVLLRSDKGIPLVEVPPGTPEAKVAWKGTRAYLSDLEEFDVKSGPWPFMKNGHHGEGGKWTITVKGKQSHKGLSMAPPSDGSSRARYRLGKQAVALETSAALDDQATTVFGAVTFEVVGDGTVLWKSTPLRARGMPEHCRVSLKGVEVLELRATVQGSYFGAQAVWIDPVIFRPSEESPAVGEWKVGPGRRLADLSVRTLCEGGGFLPLLANAADGKSFYTLEPGGVLRRIDWQTLKETNRVELVHPALSLAVSQRGVLVLLETPQIELWLLDPLTLAKRKRTLGANRSQNSGPC